jgi:ABC-type Fe3+ transport system permease subunit
MSDSTHSRRPPKRSIEGWRWAGRGFLVLLLAYTLIPMAWMLITSLKTGFAAMQYPPQWWPAEPTLENYTRLLDPRESVGRDFLRYFWNSLVVSGLHHCAGRDRGGSGGLRLFALPLSGAPFFCSLPCSCATCFRP